MNYLNISLIESGIKTRANAGWNINFRPDAINSKLKKSNIRALKIKKPMLLDSMVFALLFGLFNLIESINFNVINFSMKS